MKIYTSTSRFILREIVETDAQSLFEMDSNPNVHMYLGNNPVTHIEQIENVITMIRKQYLENGIGRWAIIDKITKEFLGWTGLKLNREMINNHIDFYDLGYRLNEKHWGKGIATETSIASLEYAFQTINTNEVFSMCQIENVASRHVIEKLGFKYIETCEFMDSTNHWFRITKDEWMEQNKMP